MSGINEINWNEQLIRCSALGSITSFGRGAVITDKQRSELDQLLAKIELTVPQAKRRDELIAKRDAKPELSQGAKSFLKQLFLEVAFGRYKDIDTKYTRKGTEVEHLGIAMANRVLGWGLQSDYLAGLDFSKRRYKNDYISGEMDLNHPEVLADVKCPWDIHTFPFFAADVPTTDYEWQLQGYMMLTGHDQAELVYALVDTPENLIIDAQRRKEWQRGDIELPIEIADQIRKEMTFGDIPEEYRIKRWIIKRDEAKIDRIKMCVEMSREYLWELTELFLAGKVELVTK